MHLQVKGHLVPLPCQNSSAAFSQKREKPRSQSNSVFSPLAGQLRSAVSAPEKQFPADSRVAVARWAAATATEGILSGRRWNACHSEWEWEPVPMTSSSWFQVNVCVRGGGEGRGGEGFGSETAESTFLAPNIILHSHIHILMHIVPFIAGEQNQTFHQKSSGRSYYVA